MSVHYLFRPTQDNKPDISSGQVASRQSLSGHYECPCTMCGLEVLSKLVEPRIVGVLGRKVLITHTKSGLGNRATASLLFANEQAVEAFIDTAARVAIEGHSLSRDAGAPC